MIRRGEMEITNWYTAEEMARLLSEGWMNSDGHRANILNERYVETGVGVVIGENFRLYATQNFC